jgi:hypothetical protein
MVQGLPGTLLGIRDRALILLGFTGAMRRSELVGLDVSDLAQSVEGLTITIRKSKTDQLQAGRKVGIPFGAKAETCPVRAVKAWLEASKTLDGPVFRSVNKHGQVLDTRLCDRAVAEVVKRSLKATGRNSRGYSGHSLRAGLVTQAAISGVSERAIQDQSGHKAFLSCAATSGTALSFGRMPRQKLAFRRDTNATWVGRVDAILTSAAWLCYTWLTRDMPRPQRKNNRKKETPEQTASRLREIYILILMCLGLYIWTFLSTKTSTSLTFAARERRSRNFHFASLPVRFWNDTWKFAEKRLALFSCPLVADV